MKSKIELIRREIYTRKLGGYIIPSSDEFGSEYPCESFQRLTFVTGFNCSNGYLLILPDKIYFLTDGRYTEAAKDYFLDTEIVNLKEAKTLCHNIAQDIKDVVQIGYNPKLFNTQNIKLFEGLCLKECEDLVDIIWTNKPALPNDPVLSYDIEFTGETTESKISRLREYLKTQKAESIFITSPDSICWLLNIRGHDGEFTGSILSYLYLSMDEVVLFAQPHDLTRDLTGDLTHDLTGDLTRDLPEELKNHKGFEHKTLDELDGALISARVPTLINRDANLYILNKIPQNSLRVVDDPILHMRAIKNKTEIHGAIRSHQEDAIALIEFLAYLEEEIDTNQNTEFDEYKLGEILTGFRRRMPSYIKDSFAPIVGFRENGAKIHYKASRESALKIPGISSSNVPINGLLLIDSGGHYFGGTTDVTRTISIGAPTNEERYYYTMVLKGHIALSMAKFPKGITGAHLDILARQFLWESGDDYAHGTGHGVGNFLSVHEGPVSISLYSSKHPLEEGMILSNEPGYYREGGFGIRIENLQYVRKSKYDGFYEFEQLTLAPYCKKLIDHSLLTGHELEYIQQYHARILEDIGPSLSARAKGYLNSHINYGF